MDEQALRSLHDVLDHHGRIRDEQLAKFERAVELQAVAMLLQAETLGTTTGEVEVLVKRLNQKLRERGVLP